MSPPASYAAQTSPASAAAYTPPASLLSRRVHHACAALLAICAAGTAAASPTTDTWHFDFAPAAAATPAASPAASPAAMPSATLAAP
ncbi:MAG TPA: hypothetical protein VGF27_04700, partial [Pseudoduganella sp.]